MRQILALMVMLLSLSASGQSDSVTFCKKRLKVPTGCSAESEYQVKCDHYSMTWLYMTAEMMQTMPDQFINKLASRLKGFRKEPVTCFLLGSEAKGYKIRYNTGSQTGFQLVAYGVANEQPVLFQLVLDREPQSIDDIPDLALEIISFNK